MEMKLIYEINPYTRKRIRSLYVKKDMWDRLIELKNKRVEELKKRNFISNGMA